MPHTRDEVVAVVQKTFPETSCSRVLELLDSYGVESYERERERVQLAILKLSEGNEEKLSAYGFSVVVGTAKSPVRKNGNGNGNGQPH